jgi:hypothetical protein
MPVWVYMALIVIVINHLTISYSYTLLFNIYITVLYGF